MTPADTLSTALEAGIAAQLALVIPFLLAGPGRRHATALCLAAICLCVAAQIGLNSLASAIDIGSVRLVNYFLDLSIGPLILAFVVRAGNARLGLRPAEAWHLLWLPLGLMVLGRGSPVTPDMLVAFSQLAYLTASAFVAWRRRSDLLRSRLAVLTVALLVLFAAALPLRLWIAVDAPLLADYRESIAYPLILGFGFAASSILLWTALRNPRRFVSRGIALELPPEELDQVEAEIRRLVEGERLYLNADLTLESLARRLDLPSRRISTVMSARFGESLPGYLNRLRAEAAARALREMVGQPITTILYDSGFGSKSAFQREFKRRFGISPSEYRLRFGSPE